MDIRITHKVKQEFNKNWKKVTSDSVYLVPETIDEINSLEPFPYSQIENIWVFPTAHTTDAIHHFTKLVHEIVGEKLF